MDGAAVWAEYERLGYKAGWVFAMTPFANLATARTMVIGLNPGGGAKRTAQRALGSRAILGMPISMDACKPAQVWNPEKVQLFNAVWR